MRTAITALALFSLPMAAFAQPAEEQGPLPPTGLTATVYSATTAEVFWDRITAEALRYEVSVNGEQVATTDGISQLIELPAGTPIHQIDVVAIRANGLRSGAASVQLGDPQALLTPPQGVTMIIYSTTAAELFWERYPPEADVFSVLVYRDGALIGETLGTSYFDDTRSSSASHSYFLVATNADGQQSDAVSIADADATDNLVDGAGQDGEQDAPRDDPAQSPTTQGIDVLLSGVFSVINGAPYQRLEQVSASLVDIATASADEEVAGFSRAVDAGAAVESGEDSIRRYVCEAGGELGVAVQDAFTTKLTLSACGIGNTIANGSIVTRVDAGLLMSLAPFEILNTDGTRARWQGTRDLYRASTVLSAGLERSASIAEVADTEGNITTLERATVDFAVSGRDNASAPKHRLSASFSVRAPWTGQRTVRVATAEEFIDLSADGYYQTGVLEVALPDGTLITLDAGTGDPGTYRATTRSTNGDVESQLRAWSAAERLPCLSDTISDAGCGLIADAAYEAGNG